MGLAPESAGEGYLTCVLLGGQTPFVLRTNENFYYLIGSCYPHEIMDGEAMDQLRLGGFELEDFPIK